jgi:site-specific DNA-methyltransferase (adenine-specific)
MVKTDLCSRQPGDSRIRDLGQYFTPRWAAERLVEGFFPDLNQADCVVEPSCGDGSFLAAIPEEVRAIGVELDPALAEVAASNTGRTVLCGDFRVIDLPEQPTVILGNPPFRARLIHDFLERSRRLLSEDGRCGFVLPAYALQHAGRVCEWSNSWGLAQTMLPRGLFPRLSKPLVFCMFTKTEFRFLRGFSLYQECAALQRVRPVFRALLIRGRGRRKVWRAVVEEALARLGGEAELGEIYGAVEPLRPSRSQWWHEKVRQVLQLGEGFLRVGKGRWRWLGMTDGGGSGEQLQMIY